MKINELEPNTIWKYFYEVTQIPRPSKKEGKMIDYLQRFAKEHGLQFKRDDSNNVLISKKGTKGREDKPITILQCHLDMVCEKQSDSNHDFLVDPIQTYIEDGWVKATGTTLGADDGIGIAAQLAVLAASNLHHGPLECLFTADEETGLTGAAALQEGFISGSTLLNLDSEDDGELCIGCAGGIMTTATFAPKMEEIAENAFVFELKVSGLLGGHSGEDINKGRENAVLLLSVFLEEYAKTADICLIDFNGGNLHNAIPREAKLTGVIPFSDKEQLRVAFNEYIAEVESARKSNEPNIRFELKSVERTSKWSWTKEYTEHLLHAFTSLPNGVIEMHPSIANLVRTSSNLASVKTKDQLVSFTSSQRSSSEVEKANYAKQIKDTLENHFFKVYQSDGYPGWEPNPNSAITALAAECYLNLFDEEAKLVAIHAGLECGLFLSKYPHLDMVSFGPTMKGVHSPDERLNIETVGRFWKLLITILEKI